MSLRRTDGRPLRRWARWALAMALVALSAIACMGGDGPSSPGPSPSGASPSPIVAPGKIAYIDKNGDLALINPDGTGTAALSQEGHVKAFRWSPDGSRIAVESEEGGFGVRVLGLDGAAAFALGRAASPVWSPAGDRLVVSEGSSLVVYDAGGGRLVDIADATDAAWSPDGKFLAFLRRAGGGRKGVPMLLDLSTQREAPLSADIEAGDPTYPLAWRPGTGLVAYRDAIYDPAGGEKVDLPGVPSFWSPNGRLLLVTLKFDAASKATPANFLELDQGAKPLIGLEVRVAPENVPAWLYIQHWTAWSPDGRYLIYLDPDPSRLRARIYDSVAVRQAIYPNIRGELPSFSPDDRYIVFMDGGKVWVLARDGSALVSIVEGSYPAWQPGA